MTTFDEPEDVQPTLLVTVKFQVPDERLVTVVLEPDPEIFPGLMVHVPAAGKPFNTTLPVVSAQVGWVIAPVVGAVGADGSALMTTLAEDTEVQPPAFVTV